MPEHNRKVSVVVIDGVCIGHPCCGVPHCKIPLKTNRDRFCPTHNSQNSVCAVVDCTNLVTSGSKVCYLAAHQAAEQMHNDQGKSRFQLRERLKRAQLAYPNNSVPVTPISTPSGSVDDDLDESEVLDSDLVDHNGEVLFDLTQDGHTIPTTAEAQTLL